MAALSLCILQIFFLVVSVCFVIIGNVHGDRFDLVASVVANTFCVVAISLKAIFLLRAEHARRAFQFSLLTLPACLITQVFLSILTKMLR